MRIAAREDFEIVFPLIQKLWDYNTYDLEKTYLVYERVVDDPDSEIFLIEAQGKVVGFCHWNMYDTFWLSGRTCYLSGLYIEEAWRGRGYGKEAIAILKKRAKERGCRGIILESGLPRTKTHAFYSSQGFEKSCYGFECML